MKKLILIDGYALLFRSYFATAYTGKLLRGADGTPTNALYPMLRIIEKLRASVDEKNTLMLVAFDAGKKTNRHKIFKDYKGGRKETPNELIQQIPLVKKAISLLGINSYEKDGIEADDICGILAEEASKKNYKVEIYTSDKDFLQLVSKNISLMLTVKGFSEINEVTSENFLEKYSIEPKLIPDLKALAGDSSDNIPGVPGVGSKTAISLIKKWGSLENIFSNVNEIKEVLKIKLIDNKEKVFLFRELTTIIKKLDIDVSVEDCFLETINREQLVKFLLQYNINSIANKYRDNLSEEQPTFHFQKKIDFEKIKLEETLWVSIFTHEKENYLAIGAKNKGWFEKISNINNYDFLLNKKLLFFIYKNITKIIPELLKINYENIYDLGISSYSANTDVNTINKAVTFFNILDTKINFSDFENRELRNILSSLAALFPLFRKLCEQDKLQSKFRNVYDLDFYLQKVLLQIENHGMKIDIQKLKKFHIEISKKVSDLKNLIIHYSENKEMNVNSSKQIGEFLFVELKLPNKNKKSTDITVLKNMKNLHPVVPVIIEYRKFSKLFSTYIKGFENYIDHNDKIHTTFIQNGTATGRLSSKKPNVQNISIRNEEQRKFRKIFIPSFKNWLIVSADYSQIELKLVAHFCKDVNMINLFNSGEDVHEYTASKIFRKSRDKITPEERSSAKTVNFGILYGMSEYGLAQQINRSPFECSVLIKNYFENFPEIEKYQKELIRKAKEKTYLETFLGHRRYFYDITSSNFLIRKAAERAAINFPIQGTAADIIKLAMNSIYKEITHNKLPINILAQIHDELIFEIDSQRLKESIKMIKNIMENAVNISVKLFVNFHFGENLYDAK